LDNNHPCTRWLLLLCASSIALAGLAGCGRSPTLPMSGKITLEGVALPTGTIALTPIDKTAGPSVGSEIVDGCYSIQADRGPLRGGNYRVEIRSIDPKSASMTDPMPIFRDRVPARYNSASQLTLPIPSEASSVRQDYDLKKQ
jgi:hypothetical protein